MKEKKLIEYINLIKVNELKIYNINKTSKYIENLEVLQEKTLNTYRLNIIMILSQLMKDEYNFDYTFKTINRISIELFNIKLNKATILKEVQIQNNIIKKKKDKPEVSFRKYQRNINKFKKEYKEFIEISKKINEELLIEILKD